MVRIFYQDKRGAQCWYNATGEQVMEVIKRLHRRKVEATIKDQDGDIVGGIQPNPEGQWVWWIEKEYLPTAT